jgi:hypothetical protein
MQKNANYHCTHSAIGSRNDSNDDFVEIEADEVLHQSEAAFLFSIDGEDAWLPKSQIECPDDIDVGDENVIVGIKRWLAVEKGLA